MAKNYLAHILNTKVPLILGISSHTNFLLVIANHNNFLLIIARILVELKSW